MTNVLIKSISTKVNEFSSNAFLLAIIKNFYHPSNTFTDDPAVHLPYSNTQYSPQAMRE